MRILFLGTPEFAVPSLEMLIEEGYEVIGVVTQPDKPRGRGNKITMSPVKECALKHQIPVYQPPKIKDPEFVEELKRISPDLMITAAYGQILSKAVLDIPRYGCINVHASLLPKYRGAAPINWCLINGEKVTGITTMYTDVGLDTGDMALSEAIEIGENETAGELEVRLAKLGAKVLKETLRRLEDGTLPRIPQNESEASYFPLISKELGKINWEKSAAEVFNLLRGLTPKPGVYTFYKGNKLRIWKGHPKALEAPDITNGNIRPGTILKVTKDLVEVSTGSGTFVIEEIQADNSRRMTVREYLAGHTLSEGEVLE